MDDAVAPRSVRTHESQRGVFALAQLVPAPKRPEYSWLWIRGASPWLSECNERPAVSCPEYDAV